MTEKTYATAQVLYTMSAPEIRMAMSYGMAPNGFHIVKNDTSGNKCICRAGESNADGDIILIGCLNGGCFSWAMASYAATIADIRDTFRI